MHLRPYIFPERVIIDLMKSPCETTITDAETGRTVRCSGFKIEVSADQDHTSELTITIPDITARVEGLARYEIDEAGLRRLARHNGFDLVPLAKAQPVPGVYEPGQLKDHEIDPHFGKPSRGPAA